MAGEFRTGIQSLDRELPDGILPGSLVLLKARPDTQSELLLQTFSNNRDTVYITVHRDKPLVEERLKNSPFLTNMPHIIDISQSSPLDDLKQKIQSIPEDCYVIIDSIDLIERLDSDRYRNFLNEFQNALVNTESVGFMHAYKYEKQSPPTARVMTEGICDVIFNLQFSDDGEDINNRLVVSKFRGGKALDKSLKLTLTDTVDVDTSRDI